MQERRLSSDAGVTAVESTGRAIVVESAGRAWERGEEKERIGYFKEYVFNS